MTLREEHVPQLRLLESFCRDTHRSFIRDWEDVIDSAVDDDTLKQFRVALIEALGRADTPEEEE